MVTENCLYQLGSSCLLREELDLTDCSGINDIGELSDLELHGLSNISSIGIQAVAVGCKRLTDLDLKHCEKINDSGFWALAFYSQNLRQVSFDNKS
ncbi:hypothetical protein RIF29_25118 [Crotalaria pallida]|uniref:Uncharacterized protein n=1 Tax=Crotalaria pallida TaxID=3830 RepID=A0AAN9I0T3_CROPI